MGQGIEQRTTRTPIPTGVGNVRDSKTWSVYTYQNYFRIAYPPSWHVVPDAEGNGVSFMTSDFHQDDDFSMPYDNSYDVSYSIFGKHAIEDMQLKTGDQFPSDTTSETMVVTNLVHLFIDGYPAISFDYYPTDNVNFIHTRYIILKDNTLYRFDATYPQDANKHLFSDMIASLQFIQK